MHQARLYRTGTTDPGPLAHRPVAERFWSKVARTPDGCWLWQGYRTPFGHGQVSGPGGRLLYAHRLAYALTHGSVPDDVVIRHRCDVPACVRPDHLKPGSQGDNVADMVQRGRARFFGKVPREVSL